MGATVLLAEVDSLQEYLANEPGASFKSEYIYGQVYKLTNKNVYAMAGTTMRHADIAGNLYSGLLTRLRGRACRPYSSEVRVASDLSSSYFYPDVFILCGTPELKPGSNPETLLNPSVIFEVLSASTGYNDRILKMDAYHEIDSCQCYVLIESERVGAYVYIKQPVGWLLTQSLGRSTDVLQIPEPELAIPLTEVYESILGPGFADGF